MLQDTELLVLNRKKKLVRLQPKVISQVNGQITQLFFRDKFEEYFVMGVFVKGVFTLNTYIEESLTTKESFFLNRGYFMPLWLEESDFRPLGTDLIINFGAKDSNNEGLAYNATWELHCNRNSETSAFFFLRENHNNLDYPNGHFQVYSSLTGQWSDFDVDLINTSFPNTYMASIDNIPPNSVFRYRDTLNEVFSSYVDFDSVEQQ